MEALKSKIEDPMTLELASRFHESWRQSRYNPDTGQIEPDIETTTDEVWIAEHDNKDQVDIASTDFYELPDDFKIENIQAAEDALCILNSEIEKGGDITSDEFVGKGGRFDS